MGLFDRFKKKNAGVANDTSGSMGMSGMNGMGSFGGSNSSGGSVSGFPGGLLKDVEVLPTDKPTDILAKMPKTDSVISLEKSVISLDKVIIDLAKDTGFDFNNHQAKVAVAMDYSGSMSTMYSDGSVQRVLNRLMPLAFKFDDNGELEVWIFEDGYNRIEPMDLSNFDTYVRREILDEGYCMGGTNYAPVLKDILKKYFVEDAATSNIPVFLIFITDGDNFDEGATDRVVRESSGKNIFIKFVGIGRNRFKYLEKLDDLSGRTFDNTGFMKVSDFERMSDNELYKELLDQYPDWIKERKAKGYQ